MIEFKVRPVTRYIVTRYEQTGLPSDRVSATEEGRRVASASSSQIGEYDNPDTAYEVATALAKAEAQRLNLSPGSMDVIFPRHPRELTMPPMVLQSGTAIPAV